MKKNKLIITTIVTLLLAIPAFAHCGNCGHGDPKTEHKHHGHDHTVHMQSVLDGYLSIQKALAADDLDSAKGAASKLKESIHKEDVLKVVSTIAEAEDIKLARAEFLTLSNQLIAVASHLPESDSLYLAHCPMAFNNKGGSWIQDSETLANPYYGAMMLRCGTIKELGASSDHKHDNHEHAAHSHH